MTEKITKEEQVVINEKNAIIARYLGYKYYPICKKATWFYDCEYYKWEEMDEDDVWVLEPTEEFEKTPCTSEMYWEYERDLPKQWKDYDSYLMYHDNWSELIPIVKKVLNELWEMHIPHPDNSYNNLRNALNSLEIDQIWETTVEAIKVINQNREADGDK